MAQGLSEQDIALAREAVALPNWAWERGMFLLGKHAPVVLSVDARETRITLSLSAEDVLDTVHLLTGYVVDGRWHWHGLAFSAAPLPDLRHPCTLALVRERVRELRADPSWTPLPLFDGGVDVWVTDAPSRMPQTRYGSEAAAMVAALREGA
jgi:hypothetical protein